MISDEPKPVAQKTLADVGSTAYFALALLGLLVVFQGQNLIGPERFRGVSFRGVTLAVGLGTMVARFGWFPYLYLTLVFIDQLATNTPWFPAFFGLGELVLTIGVLLYISSIFRIHGMHVSMGVYDTHLKKPPPQHAAALPGNPRSGRAMHLAEFAGLLLMIPLVTALAQLLVQLLPEDPNNPAENVMNQAIAIIWIGVASVLGIRLLFQVWDLTQHDPESAQLFLQESLWTATRSDQDRLAKKLGGSPGMTWSAIWGWLWTIVKIWIFLLALQRLIAMRG